MITAMSLPFLAKKPIDLPPIVSVELIQITDKTNIPFAPKAKKIIEKIKEKEKKLVSEQAPPKKVKKPVDIKKVSAQYKVVLKQERFRKDVRQIKEKNVIDFHNLRYYLQKQKPHLYRKKYKVIERRKVLREMSSY